MIGILCALILNITASYGQTNSFQGFRSWANPKSSVWSEETNGFRTGLNWFPESPAKAIIICVLSSNEIHGLDYVHPPSSKFQRMELRDAEGRLIPPIKNKMNERLAQRIAVSDLPQNHDDGPFRGHGVVFHYFLLAKDAPSDFNEIELHGLYQIKQRAYYSLTVLPVIYKFEADGKYVDRIDLPSVSTKILLDPSP
jgi:hypothetical protein